MEPAAVIAPAIVKFNRAQRGVNAHADTNAVFNKAKVKIVFKTFIPCIAVIGKEYALYFLIIGKRYSSVAFNILLPRNWSSS